MANLVVPFNFQPAVVSVRSTSYTIPAGKYAKVDVQCSAGGTFTINGSTALVSATWTVLASDNLATAGVGSNGGTGLVTQANSSGASYGINSAFNESTAYDNAEASYYLPEGTTINGSGAWRAVVQEYNNIS